MTIENLKLVIRQAVAKAEVTKEESSELAALILKLQPLHPTLLDYVLANAVIEFSESLLNLCEEEGVNHE